MSAHHEEIFAAARRLPEGEREGYLAETCGSDEERRLVDSLLEKSARADSFFDGMEKLRHVHEASIVEEIGDAIGCYTLVQKLGEGGFGIVFAAEQTEPIARRVALKIIKQGMDTRQVIRRFEAERQALAMMEHPNIARVLDAGATETGRPYFAMELVEGESITRFCERHGCDLRQRLGLFLDVCAAVAHAHQKGIIHRDLKPSNVLVTIHDDKPVPKVIDFGIAKALEQPLGNNTLLTRAEQFLGTPLYVSPEQAASASVGADTRSDVYSLGVILYELLTGSTPFDSKQLGNKSHDEVRRIICEEDPPRPSTHLNSLRGDLDWIVLKALEKDRERRYESTNAFAQDIRNYLDDQPVSAAAPSVAYRLRKLVRRHRTAFGAAAVVLLALCAGLAISIAALMREKEARQDEAEQRQRAEASERSAKQISSLLQDVLGSIDPAVAQGQDTTLLESVIDAMVERIEAEISPGSIEGVELRLTAGKVYTAIGQTDRSREILNQALEGARAIGKKELLLEVLVELAWAEHAEHGGDRERIIELLQEAVTIGDPHDPKTMIAMSRLGARIRGDRGRRLAKEAHELSERLLRDEDPVRSIVFGNYYVSARESLTLEERREWLIELVRGEQKRFGEGHPRYAYATGVLANWYFRMAQKGEGDDHLVEAVRLGEIADNLNRELFVPGHDRRIEGKWRLALIYMESENLDGARETWEQALAEQKRSGRPELAYSGELRDQLAHMLERRGLDDEAASLGFKDGSASPPASEKGG